MANLAALQRGAILCLLIALCYYDLAQAQKGKKSVKGGKSGTAPKGLPPPPKDVPRAVEPGPDWEPVQPISPWQSQNYGGLEEVGQRPEDFSQQRLGPGAGEQEIGQRQQDFDHVFKEGQQTEQELDHSGKYRDPGLSQLSIQDTPPHEIARAYLTAGQFCSTWGPHHYRTFDGRMFRYQGQCRHILFKDCIHEEVFQAILDFSHCSSSSFGTNSLDYTRDRGSPWRPPQATRPDCQPKAIVSSGEESITIQAGPYGSWVVQRRKQSVSLPLVLDTISVQPAGRHLKVKAACGAMMWISPEGSMTVELPAGWRWRTCGLCGLKNGDPKDDFQSPTNTLMTDSWSFGNSWMMRDPTISFPDGCPDPERPTSAPCDRMGAATKDKASQKCLDILSPKFESCHYVVDPQLYLETCQTTCCDQDGSQGCECSAIAEYFRECQRLGGRLPIGGWRTDDLCPLQCNNGTVYGECVPTCSPTCYDSDPVCDVNTCLDGCQCPPGHVMHDGQCLDSTLCPCTLSDKEYPGGYTLKEDCNTCKCISGKWKCTETVCAAACRLVGNRHVVTFDGFWYELPKACSHYLLYAEGYSIQLEHVTCRGSGVKGGGPDGTDCGRNLVIKTKQGDPVIKLKRWLEVTADGEEITDLPTTIADVHIRIISSLYVQALLPTGVSVTWNADGTTGWISVPASFFGKTQGLCGTYTRSQADDLLTPEGDTELGPVAFARKWKSDPSCLAPHEDEVQEHPCDKNPTLRPQAEAVCKHLVTAEIFTECLIDIAPYYGACLRELCACPDEKLETCYCPILEQLASDCSRKKGSPVHWRNTVPHCGVHCTGGQEYHACANACQYSCSQMNNPFGRVFQELDGSCGNAVAGAPCLDGCACPPGQALTTVREGYQTCTPIDQCPCLHEGTEHPPGFIQERHGKICECRSGTWKCAFRPGYNGTDLDGRGFIEASCPAGSNSESVGCLSDCPVTCLNMKDPPKCHTRICKAGCRCKKGFVLEPTSNRCVRPGQCPCHHGGNSYQDGQALRMDCNNCLCKGGQWVCETGECLGKCSMHGAGHYQSFDGRVFDLEAANCAYVLLRGRTSEGESFAISAQNVPCAAATYRDPGLVCKKEVTFTVGPEIVTLSRESPIQLTDDWKLEEVGMFQHLVSQKLGIEVLWDGKTRIYIHADPKWRGQFRGLCGDFNGDPTNDFVGPSDGPPQASASHFVDSWRVHDYCPSANIIQERDSREWQFTCPPERQRWARHSCQVLKSPLFEPCHADVDHNQYLERCVEDACGCEEVGGNCDCLCTAIGSYADACAARGVAIAWRSQDLCPIQCEECDYYSPCISVCPLDTCQRRLEEGRPDCTGRPCVEGCQLKPCPEGTVRNGTSRKLAPENCVPEELCEPDWDCIINGKTFKHGEWISDATVADACQTCYCRRGELDCKGQTCPPVRIVETTVVPPYTYPSSSTETPYISTEEYTVPLWNITSYPYTPLPPIVPPPPEKQFCREHGWSHWINAFTPTLESGGDFEVLNDPKSRLRTHIRLPCSVSYMRSIKCRQVAPSPVGKPPDIYECSLPTGLVCRNNKAIKGYDGLCRDYEIMVYCSCAEKQMFVETTTEVPTTPLITIPQPFPICLPENHGWTSWANTRDAKVDPNGDFETVESALGLMASKNGGGCPLDHVIDIQCRVAGDGRSWKEVEQTGVICDLVHGLTCLHGRQPKGRKCLDYEIRVFCQCYTPPTYPPSTYPPTEAIITTEGPCPPGSEWSECPYQCDQTCMAYQHKLVIEGKCEESDPHHCVPGCQYVTCRAPFVQLDEYTCVLSDECDCVLEDGTILAAGNVLQKECQRCHCQSNSLFCADIPHCRIPTTPSSQIFVPTTCPPAATPLCQEGFTVFRDDSGPCPEFKCVPECPPGLVWSDCHPTCERTCLSFKQRPCERVGCVAGCFCPSGKVRDGEHCREPEECPDRVCEGFGDPQLVTFDGSMMNFQGKGTFTLANHVENSFTVSGRTEPCDLKMTCMVGLTVTYKGHKITIRRGQNTLGVDDRYVSIEQTPLEVGGGSIAVLAHPGPNVLVHIPDLNAEVYYFGSNAAFAIRVPVSIFYNKTKGLCGNCNKQEDDDGPFIDKDGNPDPKPICDYLTEGFYGECMEDNKIPIPVPNEEQTIILCPEFDDPIFRECNSLVEPRPYRSGCAREVMQGSDHLVAACKALLEFTRQCCLVSGSPLHDWMQDIGCEVPCPGGSKFLQCHDACPQTCVNVSASSQAMCSGLKTDACFCPPDMVFHNGHCISQSVCEACDVEGHRPGDSWQNGPCTSCHCEADLTVICSAQACPSAPNCRSDENLITDEVSDPCCLRYKCELKPVPTCPPLLMPTCAPGEVSKVKTISGECPEYQCECDPTLCPPVRWPTELEEGQRVEIIAVGGCCSHAQVLCDLSLCSPSPTCPPGTVLKELPGTCCAINKCRPPEDMCVYTPEKTVVEGVEVDLPEELRIPQLYKPGLVWQDGLCRNCTCLEQSPTAGGGFSSSCMREQCPDIKDSPDKNDYVLENIPIPGQCCPHVARIFCKDDRGELHEIGSEWKSANDTCLSYRCELSPLGDVQKVEKSIVCATCSEGHEYVSPSVRLGICCGWCRPVACEEAGRNYQLGAKWNSTVRHCYTAECQASERGSGVRTVYQGPQCPMMPKDCPLELITRDEAGCCQICNATLKPMSECKPALVPESETIGLLVVHDPRRGVCANDRPLKNLKQCAGHCQSHSLYSIDDGYFQSNCECCVADKFATFQVALKCNDRIGSIIMRTFQQPTSCSCSICSNALSDKLKAGRNEVETTKGGTKTAKTGWTFPEDSYSKLRETPDTGDIFSQQQISDKYEQRPTGHLTDFENSNFEQRPTGHITSNEHFEQRPNGGLDSDRYVQRPTGGRLTDSDIGRIEQEPTGPVGYDYIDARNRARPGSASSQQSYGQSPFAFAETQDQTPAVEPVIPHPGADQTSPFQQNRLTPSDSQKPRRSSTLEQSPFASSASEQLRQQLYPNQNSPFAEQQPISSSQQLYPNQNSAFAGQQPISSSQQLYPNQNSPFAGQQQISSSQQHGDAYSQQRQTGSSSYHQSSQRQIYGTEGEGGSYHSQSSSSQGQGGDLDEWHRQMAEHQRQVQELQDLQKTYSQLAQNQHQQQLEDHAALNQQYRAGQQNQFHG